MLEKIPEQHDSSRHVHLVSFCSTQELPLFLSLKHATSFSSSIFLPSSSSLIFPSQVSSTRELPLSMKLHLQRRRSRDTRDKKFLACIRLSALPWISFPTRCQTTDVRLQMLDQYQTIAYAFYSLNQSQSHSSPTKLLSSTPQCQNHSTQQTLPSLISSFLPSLYPSSPLPLVAIVPPFRLFRSSFFCLHSPNLHFVSFVPVSLTQETQLSLPSVELTSFQLFRLVRQCLLFVSPNFHFVFTLLFVSPFHTGIRSSDVQRQKNQSLEVFPWKQLSVHLETRTWQLERRRLWPRLV